jgi:hypothetical protein
MINSYFSLLSFNYVSKILYTAPHFTELSEVWYRTNQEELEKMKLEKFIAAINKRFVHPKILK